MVVVVERGSEKDKQCLSEFQKLLLSLSADMSTCLLIIVWWNNTCNIRTLHYSFIELYAVEPLIMNTSKKNHFIKDTL